MEILQQKALLTLTNLYCIKPVLYIAKTKKDVFKGLKGDSFDLMKVS